MEAMMNGKCDAEIGSVKHGWYVCKRNAVIEIERQRGSDLVHTLEACARHAEQLVKVQGSISTRAIRPLNRPVPKMQVFLNASLGS
jgi:hypothetical protein